MFVWCAHVHTLILVRGISDDLIKGTRKGCCCQYCFQLSTLHHLAHLLFSFWYFFGLRQHRDDLVRRTRKRWDQSGRPRPPPPNTMLGSTPLFSWFGLAWLGWSGCQMCIYNLTKSAKLNRKWSLLRMLLTENLGVQIQYALQYEWI